MLQRRDVLKLSLAGAAAAQFRASSVQAAETAAPQPQPIQPQPGQAQPPQATPPQATPQAVAPKPQAAEPPQPTAAPARRVAGPGVRLGQPTPFSGNTVQDLARELAKQPFKAVSADLPDPFRNLSYELYTGITLKPEARIWADETTGFVIEPLHRGFQTPWPIVLNLVDAGQSYKLVYDIGAFDFGKLHPAPTIGDIGFAGFRASTLSDKKQQREIAKFQGTNFFQALAEGQVAGIMARALALKVADPNGEETPYFRQMWIEKPSVVEDVLIVHALIDSESLTAAFRFTIRPNATATIMDTECSIFARANVDNLGLATMSATHLLGFMDHKKFDDYRPNVSEVCGLQMLTGAGEWVWRPVTNRETLQISTFVDNKPRGFGAMQRNRNFEDFLDEDQHWERRPSLWVEPLGEWAEGGVQLIEIPSSSDNNDNILCFWRPKAQTKAGSESAFAYRQFWCWEPPERPDLARAVRSHAGSAGKHRKFFVEFEGDILGDGERTRGMSPTLTATGGSITMVRTFPEPERKAYRILFELDPANAESSELRLVLEAQGQRISETWLYRWTPT